MKRAPRPVDEVGLGMVRESAKGEKPFLGDPGQIAPLERLHHRLNWFSFCHDWCRLLWRYLTVLYNSGDKLQPMKIFCSKFFFWRPSSKFSWNPTKMHSKIDSDNLIFSFICGQKLTHYSNDKTFWLLFWPFLFSLAPALDRYSAGEYTMFNQRL